MKVLVRDTETFSRLLGFQIDKKSLIISEGMLRDSRFLAHFVKNGLVIDAVHKIGNRRYSIRGIIVEKDIYCQGADQKKLKRDAIKQNELGLS